MDVDENFSITKPKTPAKPGQEPETSLTHKTPAEIKPTVCTHNLFIFLIIKHILIVFTKL